MQTELLGHCASGVNNIVLVTGSPLSVGAEQDAWPDLRVDSIGAVNLALRLNHGEDVGGNPIGEAANIAVGVRLEHSAYDTERERSRVHWKVEAGAEFGVLTPTFDAEALEVYRKTTRASEIPVIATVWPLTSVHEAEFFGQRSSTVSVRHTSSIAACGDEARAEREEGVAIAIVGPRAVRGMVQGIQVVAPDGDIDRALQVLKSVER